MRYLADVIYYQLYRWYDFISIKRIFDPDPHYTAFLTFGAFLGVYIATIFDIILSLITRHSIFDISNDNITRIIFFVLMGLGVVMSYQLFRKKKRYIQIVKKKPLLKNSVPLSIFITIMYMIIFGIAFGWRGLIHEIFFK